MMNKQEKTLKLIKLQLDSLKSINSSIKNVIEKIEYLIRHSGINL